MILFPIDEHPCGCQISGLVLNTSYFLCPSCESQHELFGSARSFKRAAEELKVPILGELPLVPAVNAGGDGGVPFMLSASEQNDKAAKEWNDNMKKVAAGLWEGLHSS